RVLPAQRGHGPHPRRRLEDHHALRRRRLVRPDLSRRPRIRLFAPDPGDRRRSVPISPVGCGPESRHLMSIAVTTIIRDFAVHGRVVSAERYGNGHINDTYLVV